MPEQVFFESAFRLAKQVKGAALTGHEKQAIIHGFHKTSGSAFDRVLSAIADVLHTTPGGILKKGEAIDDILILTEETRLQAKEWEANVLAHLQQ